MVRLYPKDLIVLEQEFLTSIHGIQRNQEVPEPKYAYIYMYFLGKSPQFAANFQRTYCFKES